MALAEVGERDIGLLHRALGASISEAELASRWRESEFGFRRFLAARSDDEFVGVVSLRNLADPLGALHAFELLVRPSASGRWLGSAICRQVIAEAVAAGYASIHIDVALDNRAMHLYRRLGFEPTGEEISSLYGVFAQEVETSATNEWPGWCWHSQRAPELASFLIYQKLEFSVILADSLGFSYAQGEAVPLLVPHIVDVATDVFAAFTGNPAIVLEMLEVVRRSVDGGEALAHAALCEKLAAIGLDAGRRWRDHDPSLASTKIPLVLTGPLRHPMDVAAGCTTTLIVWEAVRTFLPERAAVYLLGAPDQDTAALMKRHINEPELQARLDGGPFAVASVLDLIHNLAARASNLISVESNVMVVGAAGEFALLKGNRLVLPNPIFGG